MKQTTIHGFEAGPGEDDSESEIVGDALDHLIGTWTQEEADELDRAVAELSPRE